jgi:catecholate siderophore receptor
MDEAALIVLGSVNLEHRKATMKKQKGITQISTHFSACGSAMPPSMKKTSLVIGISTAMLLPLAAVGAEQEKDNDTVLKTVKVQDKAIDPNPNAQPGVPYKANTSGDGRHTRPLAETPQTITVLTKAAIDDSGSTDLRQILDAQPGITLGTGENGNAFGDRYIIRGQEARSDVFVDGLRDPGMSIRESFAIEQLEISKGPNSSFAGRGTAGGAINAITKQATQAYHFAKLSAGVGSDNYQRYTVDANETVGDQFAVRANVLWAQEDVPDRDPADRERKGAALSGLWTVTDDLDITLDWYRFQGEDKPDVGTYVDRNTRNVRHDIPVYLQDSDFLKSDVESFTGRVNYHINDNLHFTNLMRYGTTDNGYVTTGAGPATTGANNPGGIYATSTLDSGHTGWQEVEYFANQSNLFLTQDIAGMKNEFIFGAEYTNHTVTRGNYSLGIPAGAAGGRNCITTGSTPNAFCITDASGNTVSNVGSLQNRDIVKNPWNNDWNVKSTSAYIMDTVDLTDKITAFAGIRYDYFDYEMLAPWNHDGDSGTGASPNVLGDFKDKMGVWNSHIGLTYKFNPELMVYTSYSTASDINGGESDVGTATGYGGLAVNVVCTDRLNSNPALRGCDPNGSIESDPEKVESIEAGAKWNIFDDNLLLTAAVFQTTKDNVMEGSGYDSGASFNTGKNRVRGIELGVTGEITEDLTAQAGYTLMKSEVLASAIPVYEGESLGNFAQNSSFAQLKYQATDAFAFGGGLRYEGSRYVGQPDTAAVNATTGEHNFSLPSYTVFDAFATYRFSKEFDARINVTNLTDEDYYLAGYRSGNFVYIGDARAVRLTLNYEFH